MHFYLKSNKNLKNIFWAPFGLFSLRVAFNKLLNWKTDIKKQVLYQMPQHFSKRCKTIKYNMSTNDMSI